MYIASLKITGISSILMSNPLAMAGATPVSIGVKKHASPEDEAKKRAYIDDDGSLYAPSMWFRSSMVKACTNRKFGKMSAKTVILAAVFTTADRVTLLDPAGAPIKDYKLNIARAVVQGAGVMRARPEIASWHCLLDLEIDETFLPDPQPIVDLFNVAGKIAGVGDWRPGKGGTYGRYSAELVSNAIAAPKQKRKSA